MTADTVRSAPAPAVLRQRVLERVHDGARFCGMFGTALPAGTGLAVVLADGEGYHTESAIVPGDQPRFPSLTPDLPGAEWYEREIHDLFGLEPVDHPRLDALVLPRAEGSPAPRPGSGKPRDSVEIDFRPLPQHVQGDGMFTIPYGPVRSGVFESVEYLVETPGEDIPHLRTRVFHKHRGVEVRFEGMTAADGVLLAERTEGVASVAHALAYCGAVETLSGADVPEAAGLVRVVHAELERIANHLESAIRHVEGAGQAVAFARLAVHKERVQRLRGRLCGSRFGRGVVVPGGVTGGLRMATSELFAALDQIDHGVGDDLRLLMATPSFLDRLRGTGVIRPDLAERFGALGPLGRASGQPDDARVSRPYAAYRQLGHVLPEPRADGDALARQEVRIGEIAGAFHLIRQAVDRLDRVAPPEEDRDRWAVPLDDRAGGEAIGWAEAPQGELLTLVAMDGGRLTRVKPRSASFHNLGLFQAAFPSDILTDFAFIEASFGLSIAGAAS